VKLPEITVVTAVIGQRAFLREDQVFSGARFVAFTDATVKQNSGWIQRPARNVFSSPRRNARLIKVLIHQFVNTEYSIWIDGNVSLRIDPSALISDWMSGVDLASFAHSSRNCTYEEARVCSVRNLDDPKTIGEQMSKYREIIKPNQGLAETTVVIRRHNKKIEEFNNAWWSELCRYSVRDQLSFAFAAAKTEIKYKLCSPSKMINPFFNIINKMAEQE
jgi:hypothetical protein